MKQTQITSTLSDAAANLFQQLNTKLTVWLAIAVTFIVSLLCVINRGAAVEWILLIMTVSTFLLSYVAPYFALKGVVLKRTWTSHGSDGAEAQIHTTIERKWSIPVVWFASYETIVNVSDVDQSIIELKQHYIPLFYRKMTQQFKLNQLKRGQYESAVVTVVVGDLFGLTVMKKNIAVQLSFTVLPVRLEEQKQTYLSQLTTQKWVGNPNKLSETHDVKDKQQIVQEEATSEINGIRAYSEGDSVHRIYFHALSRGMGVHVLEQKEQISSIRQVIFIDQYMPPMSTKMYSQQMNTLIGWTLDKVIRELPKGPILIVTDNWCYEFYEYYQLEELRRLLSSIKPDVQYSIAERLMSLATLLPSYSKLIVYSTDWKNSEGWAELAQLAWHKKVSVSLQLLTEHRVLTYTMREQQREFEQNGIQTVWRFSNLLEKDAQIMREGSEQYAVT